MVLPHEIRDDAGHGVVAGRGSHHQPGARDEPPGRAAQRNHGVEDRSAGHGRLRLVVPENDVQHRLPDADDGPVLHSAIVILPAS